jgi:bacterial/archaeal transporter family-2 protein
MTRLLRVQPVDLAGGAIVATYVISVTLLAPRFGVGNTIAFVMAAQLLTSALIDHLDLFGATIRPIDPWKASGLGVMLFGLALPQMSGFRG